MGAAAKRARGLSRGSFAEGFRVKTGRGDGRGPPCGDARGARSGCAAGISSMRGSMPRPSPFIRAAERGAGPFRPRQKDGRDSSFQEEMGHLLANGTTDISPGIVLRGMAELPPYRPIAFHSSGFSTFSPAANSKRASDRLRNPTVLGRYGRQSVRYLNLSLARWCRMRAGSRYSPSSAATASIVAVSTSR